jgi:hypothetical protein
MAFFLAKARFSSPSLLSCSHRVPRSFLISALRQFLSFSETAALADHGCRRPGSGFAIATPLYLSCGWRICLYAFQSR